MDATNHEMTCLAMAVAALAGDGDARRAASERLRSAGQRFHVPHKAFETEELRARWREGFTLASSG